MENKLKQAREIINSVDKKMAELFAERMNGSKMVAEYKQAHGLEVLDAKREQEVIAKNSAFIEDEKIRGYYVNFLKSSMAISRSYQEELMQGMRVAYSGTEGAFAHIASSKMFPTAKKIAYADFERHSIQMFFSGVLGCAIPQQLQQLSFLCVSQLNRQTFHQLTFTGTGQHQGDNF